MEDNFIDFNIKHGLSKLWKWKFWIMGACALAGAVSVFFSLRLQDEFKSTAAFVPPSFSSLSTMTFGNGVAYRGFYSAEEEDLDRTIDYLTSPQVVDSIAKMYDLYNHYGIDMSNYKRDKVFYLTFYSKNDIDFSGNSTVVIECWDVNPGLAHQIAQTYLEIAEEYFETVSQRKLGMLATERALEEMKVERQVIHDSLAFFRSEYGIYHINNSGDEISKLIAQKMRTEPNFHKHYDEARSMEIYLSTLELRFGDLQREYMTRKLNMEQFPSLIWTTKEPTVPTFKARPKRSIIVIMAVLATFVLVSFLVVVLDKKKLDT